MKSLQKTRIIIIFVILTLVNYSCSNQMYSGQQTGYVNPSWAPAYNGVRYFYIPDIETFYDLTNQDFVYLNNGQWMFSYDLPPIYNGYDLSNAYIVALDNNVFQPWMHFHYYVSNYPRYYYRSVYNDANVRNIRGFNENERKPLYWTQEDRERVDNNRRNASAGMRSGTSRPPQNANYYGKQIGHNVKVESQMKDNSRTNSPARSKKEKDKEEKDKNSENQEQRRR